MRIAWSVWWGVLALVLIILSIRNLDRVDRITWHYSWPNALQVSFEPGSAVVATFVDQPLAVAAGSGSGVWYQPWYESVRHYRPTEATVAFSRVSRTNYEGVRLPMWSLILIAATCASFPWMRFSLRTLLLAMTLVVGLMGAAIWLRK